MMRAAVKAPLSIEPFLVQGAVQLSESRPRAAEELFREARRRDPRSTAARYFLAQYYLGAGRVVDGLAEASALARLVSGGGSALVPALVRYADSPGAVPNLRKLFAIDPGLRDSVLADLSKDASNAALVMSLAGNGLDSKTASVPDWQPRLLRAMVERGNFAQAYSLWRRISDTPAPASGLFNPGFKKMRAPAPFNWTLTAGAFGVAEPSPSGGLRVMYYGREDGQFASQLLLLAPGSYQLKMQVTRDDGGAEVSGLAWTLTCQPGAKQLVSLPLTQPTGHTGTITGDFVVPSRCPAQQLVLNGISREFAQSEQVTISNLDLLREGS
jgi:hypothetical protein